MDDVEQKDGLEWARAIIHGKISITSLGEPCYPSFQQPEEDNKVEPKNKDLYEFPPSYEEAMRK